MGAWDSWFDSPGPADRPGDPDASAPAPGGPAGEAPRPADAGARAPANTVQQAQYSPVLEFFVGRRGYGKSYLVRQRAAELYTAGASLVVVHDPHPRGSYPFDGAALGDRDPRGKWAVYSHPREWKGEPVVVFRRCRVDDVAEFIGGYEGASGLVEANGGVLHAVVVYDELDMVCSARAWKAEGARNIVHYCRHSGVSMLGGARRFASVHGDVYGLADAIHVFRLTHPRDLDTVEEHWGPGARRMVRHLPRPPSARSHFLTFSDDWHDGEEDGALGDAAVDEPVEDVGESAGEMTEEQPP